MTMNLPIHTEVENCTASTVDPSDSESLPVMYILSPGKRYLTSWGCCIRFLILLWTVALVSPLIVILTFLEPGDSSSGVLVLASVLIFGVFLLLLTVMLCAPSCLVLEPGRLQIRISPCSLLYREIDTSEILCIHRNMSWRELCLVTDWSKSVVICLKDATRYVVSLEDPEEFVNELSVCLRVYLDFSVFLILSSSMDSAPLDYPLLKSIVPFCGVSNVDDCIIEYVLLLWPYYIFLLILLPVRTYEIRLLPRSYPPQWWPLSHLMKRVTVLAYVGTVLVAAMALFIVGAAEPYVMLSAFLHITCWLVSYWILSSEYKRYQPLTWFGLRGFWLLTGIEGVLRSIWLIASPIDSTPTYGVSYPAITLITTLCLSLLEVLMALLVVFVPNDLNVNLLGHIQRLLLEHPSANSEYCTSQPAIYTLHEDDNNTMSRESKRRADTPGWIYSVEEELPFYPKIDVVDVFVLAVNRDKRIKTVYRVHTRVTTDTQMVVEFNAKRRYRELRFLDDKLRSVFDHSKFPEQRAGLGNFPPRELTQADPFARQIAIREYLRRLSGNPIFYTQEFLDMVGVDPRFDSGRLYESCLGLQNFEQGKLPVRSNTGKIGARLTIEPMPWRAPVASVSSGTVSPIGEFLTPPLQQTAAVVSIPSLFEFKKIIYYRIVTEIGSHVCESKHRFSDFQRLAVHLKDFLGVCPSVPLPRLIRIPGSQSVSDFLETRRQSLQMFLKSVLSDYPNVVSSRFVRTFFKLPADLVLPSTPFGSEEWDTNDDQTATQVNRQTPTGSNMSFKLSQSHEENYATEHNSVVPAVGLTDPNGRLHSSIPFVAYSVSTDPPSIRFCVRLQTTESWTRFHTFEEFLKLKNELNLNWNDIDNGLVFPPTVSHFRIHHAAEDKLRDEHRRRGLASWLASAIHRAGSRMEHIEPLWAFVRCEEEVEEDSYLN